MDSKTLKTIKDKLLIEKGKLEKELAQFARKTPKSKDDYQADFPEFGSKDDENAAEVAAFGDRISLERRLEETLADVNRALERIKKGSYGICKYCKNPINEERLTARPTSGSCINCKRELKGTL